MRVGIPVAPTLLTYTFQVPPNKVREGIYRLTAVINHTPAGAPPNSTSYTQMAGFAESSPVQFTTTPAESNYPEGTVVRARSWRGSDETEGEGRCPSPPPPTTPTATT